MKIPYNQQRELLYEWEEGFQETIHISQKDYNELIETLKVKSEQYQNEANKCPKGKVTIQVRYLDVALDNGKRYRLERTFSSKP